MSTLTCIFYETYNYTVKREVAWLAGSNRHDLNRVDRLKKKKRLEQDRMRKKRGENTKQESPFRVVSVVAADEFSLQRCN